MAAVMLMLAGCEGVAAPTGMHKEGRPSIVSLNPCSDAILAEVAAPGQLRAISHYSHNPASSSMGVAAARRYPAVSGSVEEIATLAPDIVIADVFLPAPTAQALRDLGIEVVTVGSVNSVASSDAQVRQLAAATRNVGAGERLIGKIEQSLREAAPPRVQRLSRQSSGRAAGSSRVTAP